jgi:hypothetical protein
MTHMHTPPASTAPIHSRTALAFETLEMLSPCYEQKIFNQTKCSMLVVKEATL